MAWHMVWKHDYLNSGRYDHHLHSEWSQWDRQLFRVKVINNESLYSEGSIGMGGKPADVIHLLARASSHSTKEVCYQGFHGTTHCHHLVCKDKGAIYNWPKNNKTLLPTVWECKIQAGASCYLSIKKKNRTGNKHRTDHQLSFAFFSSIAAP